MATQPTAPFLPELPDIIDEQADILRGAIRSGGSRRRLDNIWLETWESNFLLAEARKPGPVAREAKVLLRTRAAELAARRAIHRNAPDRGAYDALLAEVEQSWSAVQRGIPSDPPASAAVIGVRLRDLRHLLGGARSGAGLGNVVPWPGSRDESATRAFDPGPLDSATRTFEAGSFAVDDSATRAFEPGAASIDSATRAFDPGVLPLDSATRTFAAGSFAVDNSATRAFEPGVASIDSATRAFDPGALPLDSATRTFAAGSFAVDDPATPAFAPGAPAIDSATRAFDRDSLAGLVGRPLAAGDVSATVAFERPQTVQAGHGEGAAEPALPLLDFPGDDPFDAASGWDLDGLPEEAIRTCVLDRESVLALPVPAPTPAPAEVLARVPPEVLTNAPPEVLTSAPPEVLTSAPPEAATSSAPQSRAQEEPVDNLAFALFDLEDDPETRFSPAPAHVATLSAVPSAAVPPSAAVVAPSIAPGSASTAPVSAPVSPDVALDTVAPAFLHTPAPAPALPAAVAPVPAPELALEDVAFAQLAERVAAAQAPAGAPARRSWVAMALAAAAVVVIAIGIALVR